MDGLGVRSGAWGTSKNNIVFQIVFGKGISNYYNDNFGLGTDVGFNAKGKLVATPTGRVSSGISTTGPSYCGPRSAMVTRKSIARWATLKLRTTSATTPPLT